MQEETLTTPVRSTTPAKDEANITVWGIPQNKVTGSGYGNVTYRQWCDLEMTRMEEGGHSVKLIMNDKGMIAIARKD